MPSKYRHRSTMSWFIWGTACLVLVALLAWQFEWFPRQKANDLVETENSVAEKSGLMPTPYDPEIFQQQPEPEVGNNNPFSETDTALTQNNPYEDSNLKLAGFDSAESKSNPFHNTRENTRQNTQPNTPPPTKNSGIPIWERGDQTTKSKITNENQNSFSNNSSKPFAWEGAPSTHPSNEFFKKVDRLMADGEIFDAHHELSTLFWKHPEWRKDIHTRIEATAKAIYFSPQQHFINPYEVQYGDNLSKIAGKYKLSWQYLATLNDVNPNAIREGNKLKVHNGPFSAIIDLSDFELIVFHHGYYVRKYRIGIGKDNSSPVGKFQVKYKEMNPSYTGKDERTGRQYVIERDDPRNPLGERWIDIGNSFGIHGTINPNSIGRAESKGCIRLQNSDVAEVFDFLVVGSDVVIQK